MWGLIVRTRQQFGSLMTYSNWSLLPDVFYNDQEPHTFGRAYTRKHQNTEYKIVLLQLVDLHGGGNE